MERVPVVRRAIDRRAQEDSPVAVALACGAFSDRRDRVCECRGVMGAEDVKGPEK